MDQFLLAYLLCRLFLVLKYEQRLFAATEANDVDTVMIIIEQLPRNRLNFRCDKGRTCVFAAAELGHIESLKILVSHGVDVDMCSNNLSSPLYVACCKGHVEVVKCLLAAGAKVNLRNKQKEIPLHAAATAPHNLELCRLLVSAGANVHALNINDWTPLFCAVSSGHRDIVEFLLDNGADPSILTSTHVNALLVACSMGLTKIVDLLLGDPKWIPPRSNLLESMLSVRASGVSTTELKQPSLSAASLRDREAEEQECELRESMRQLQSSRTSATNSAPTRLYTRDLNEVDSSGQTALFVASSKGFVYFSIIIQRFSFVNIQCCCF